MAVYALKLNDFNGEVYQVETDVEITIPAKLGYDVFEGAIGFSVKMSDEEDPYEFTLAPKGIEKIIEFYNQHKNDVRA